MTKTARKLYHEIKEEWFGKPEVFDRQDVVEVIRHLSAMLTRDRTSVTGATSHRR
jgi:hypothetical protein